MWVISSFRDKQFLKGFVESTSPCCDRTQQQKKELRVSESALCRLEMSSWKARRPPEVTIEQHSPPQAPFSLSPAYLELVSSSSPSTSLFLSFRSSSPHLHRNMALADLVLLGDSVF